MLSDQIRHRNGGDSPAAWTPADWLDAQGELDTLHAMPQWPTIQLWMDDAHTHAPTEREAARAALAAILASQFVSWAGLHRFLARKLNLPGEVDARAEAAPMELVGKAVVLLGNLAMPPHYYAGLITKAGGSCESDAVTHADYLVVGAWASPGKLDVAERNGVPLRAEASLRAALCAALGVEDAELRRMAPLYAPAPPSPRQRAQARAAKAAARACEWLCICITGKLDKPRKQYHAAIEQAGGRALEDVTAECQLLVVGDKAGSKLKKAQRLGVPTCTLAEFNTKLAERGVSL